MKRINLSSDTPWEHLIGFSRLVEVNGLIYISGTTAINSKGEVIGVGDPYLQTKRVIENIANALESVGSNLRDVVRTRLFITDMTRWESYIMAHREAFENLRPACTLIGVERLIDSRLLVNMEAEAVRGIDSVQEKKIGKY